MCALPLFVWELQVEESFEGDLSNWVVEQNKGTVKIVDGQLEIDDGGGATVWFKHQLQGPIRIEYDVTLVDEGGPHDRVSDLNCFWMAIDPRHPENLFFNGHGRTGVFKQYHGLRLYYVGYGGNENKTTRFRRYTGTGERPLKPEHDLKRSNRANQRVRIRVEADGEHIRYWHGDRLVYDVRDPEPYREGWFGFRTVRNRMRIDHFRIFRKKAAAPQLPWKRHVLDRGLSGADGVRSGDVDGDGDLDLVVGWEEAGTVRIYRNPGASAEALQLSWPWIEFQQLGGVEDAQLADLDQDGHLDVIVSQESGGEQLCVFWAPSQAERLWSASEWTRMPLPLSKGRQWMFSQTGDLNGDGRPDLVAGGKRKGATVSVFSATGRPRDPASWTEQRLTKLGWVMSLELEDMDSDGDQDVLITDRRRGGAAQGLRWLEHPGSLSGKWKSHLLAGEGEELVFLAQGDVNGDALKDLVVPVLHPKQSPDAWLRLLRQDGSGLHWETERFAFPKSAGNGKAFTLADLDGDGRLDLLASFGMAIHPKRGLMMLPSADPGQDWVDISGPEGEKFDLVLTLDLDGDGDLDVLSTEEDADKNGPGLGLVAYINPAK